MSILMIYVLFQSHYSKNIPQFLIDKSLDWVEIETYNFVMNKRNSKSKLNGDIRLMQNDLMNKLANIEEPKYRYTDELGFNYYPNSQSDALSNLISKTKNFTKTYSKQIENARINSLKSSNNNNKNEEATFLTGLGLAKENNHKKDNKNTEEDITSYQQQQISDPNELLKDLINKNKNDDLQELRRLIKKTGQNLQGCSKKLNKSKKSILQIADRYIYEVPSITLKFLNNYKEFEVKGLEDHRLH